MYNATATKQDAEGNVMYYVAYEGTVTAGIDFTKIEFEVLEEEKKVIIKIPEIDVQNIKVNMGTLEYIFTKSKYETEEVSEEAYNLCIKDLKNRMNEETMFYDIARENAISVVGAFFKPWINAIDDSYTVEIR